MTKIIHEISDALESAGADPEKSHAAAGALAEQDDLLRDIRSELKLIHQRFDHAQGDMTRQFNHINQRFAAQDKLFEAKFRTLQWMLGAVVAFMAAVLWILVRMQLPG